MKSNRILKKDSKANQIELAKLYDKDIAIRLPLAWDWDKRYIDSLPYIFSFSVAVTALDCKVGDLVLDFACGSGWVSEWLNRLGYRVVSVDISEVLLNFAKKRLSCDSRVNLNDLPAYQVASDCEILPFKDETFDGVICMNSLHHMPDYQKVLDEMFRVLKKEGRAAFSEPGCAHSQAPMAAKEVDNIGVLEKDVILSDVYEKALKAGFKDLFLKPCFHPAVVNYSFYDWQRILNRMPSAINGYIDNLCNYVEQSNLIFSLHKSKSVQKDSRLPGLLRAEMKAIGIPDQISLGDNINVKVLVKNVGDTLWLSNPRRFGGYVTLDIKLLAEDGEIIENDFGRGLLPKDVLSGESAEVLVCLKAPKEKGHYILEIDMVCERITWFGAAGSMPLLVKLDVI